MILITGVSGYIGCHLATFFERKKINYIGLDNLKYSYKSNVPNKKKFYNIDISNIKRVDSLFKNFNINTVIHAAASAYVMEGEKKKNFYIKNNIINTIKFIDICKKNKIKNFIFLSSSNVYKEKKSNTAFHENDKIEPKNIYGKTKAVIEKYLITKNFNNLIILRLFNVIGMFNLFFKMFKFKRNNYQRIIFKILQNKKHNKVSNINYIMKSKKKIYPSRDFIDINTLVIIIHKILKKIKNKNQVNKIFNVGSGKTVSIMKLVKILKKKYKDKIKLEFSKISNAELVITKAKVSKLNKYINFSNKSSLEKILSSYYI